MAPDLTLAHAVQQARDAWPDVAVPAGVFESYLAERLADHGGPTALARWHVADLYLACGCALGDPAALRELDRTYLGQVGTYVARLRGDRAFVDELTQVLRHKLLVAEAPERPKILEYSGQGALGAWLRIAAVRTGLNLLRATRPADAARDDLELASPRLEQDALAKHESQRVFADAFRAALERLSPDARNLLRLHHLDGLTMDQLAGLLDTPRSTIARHLARHRDELMTATRALLSERLRLPEAELDSLIASAVSRFDLTLSKIMK